MAEKKRVSMMIFLDGSLRKEMVRAAEIADEAGIDLDLIPRPGATDADPI
jgi:hypothetical protein